MTFQKCLLCNYFFCWSVESSIVTIWCTLFIWLVSKYATGLFMSSCKLSFFYVLSSTASQSTMMVRMWIKSTSPTPSPCGSLCSHPKWAVMDAELTAASQTWVRVPILSSHTPVTSNPTLNSLWSFWITFQNQASKFINPKNSGLCSYFARHQKLHGFGATDLPKRNLFQPRLHIKRVNINLRMNLTARYSGCSDL